MGSAGGSRLPDQASPRATPQQLAEYERYVREECDVENPRKSVNCDPEEEAVAAADARHAAELAAVFSLHTAV